MTAWQPSAEIVDAVQQFVLATDWDESQRILEARRDELLTDDAERIVGDLIYEHLGEKGTLRRIEAWRTLLARARREGLDAAYAHARELVASEDALRAAQSEDRTPELALIRRAFELVDSERQHVTKAELEVLLAIALIEGAGGDRRAELDEAVSSLDDAASILKSAKLESDYIQAEQGLAVAALQRAGLTRDASDLDLAAEALTRAGFVFLRTARMGGDRQSYDQALASLRQAMMYTARDNPRWAKRRSNVGLALRYRFLDLGDSADLDEAIDAARDAVTFATDTGDPELSTFLSSLGTYLNERYEAFARRDDLDAAIDAHERADALFTEDDPRGERRGKLGIALYSRFVAEHDPSDLVQSLEAIREAAGRSTTGSTAWKMWHGNLGVALRARFELLGDAADLEDAAEALAEALSEGAEGQEEEGEQPGSRGLWLYDAGLVALSRFELTGEVGDADAAVGALEESLELAPQGSHVRTMCLRDLGVARLRRFEILGQERPDIDAAFEHLAAALESTPPGSPDWVRLQGSLGGAYAVLGKATGEREALDTAIDYYLTAIGALPETAPLRATLEVDRGTALYARYLLTGEQADLAAAIDACERAMAPLEPESWPEQVLYVARELGSLYAKTRRWDRAAEVFESGIEALDALYRRQLLRRTREAWLAKGGSIHVEAAYARAQQRDLQAATAILERGRGRILSDALARDRADLARLAELGRAELVERYSAAADELAALEHAAVNGETGAGMPAATQERDQDDALRAARARFEAAIEEVRKVAGYERFLSSPDFAEIVAAAADAPLVYLIASELGGLALLVRPEQERVEDCQLPALTEDALRERVDAFRDAYAARREARERWLTTLEDVTAWLWEAAIGPLLKALGPVAEARLIPAGLLGVLPIHAAWVPEAELPTGRRYALDGPVLTFVPNARALAAARRPAQAVELGSIVAVDEPLPQVSGVDPLPHSTLEVEGAVAGFSASLVLTHERARAPEVLNALAAAPAFHLSCHARAELERPLESHLLMANGVPLTLADMLGVRLSARLGVLSACETGLPGQALPDEVVSLPAGLIQAGAGGVVASLWSVPEESTMMLMVRLYQLWLGPERLEPPAALREAQRWLRDTTNGQKAEDLAAYLPSTGHPLASRAAEALWRSLLLETPDRRDHEHPAHWAAFAYVGV